MPVHDVHGTALSAGSLGHVLPHEHLVIDYGMMQGQQTKVDDGLRHQCREVLQRLRQHGVGTLVDCTPPGYGRDLALLAELSAESGVTVVASTGSFCEQWHPQPAHVERADAAVLAAQFVEELKADGRCGVIKAATSAGEITANEDKLLVAAAAAHRTTGAPIVSHTTDGLGLQQLDLYADEGVALHSVLVSHVCAADEPFDYAVEIARRGAYVGLDRLGHSAHDIDHWLGLVRHLHGHGLLDQVVLSHDSVQRFTGPNAIASHTFSDPTYIFRTFIPALARSGIPEEAQRVMTHENPRRWLLTERGQR